MRFFTHIPDRFTIPKGARDAGSWLTAHVSDPPATGLEALAGFWAVDEPVEHELIRSANPAAPPSWRARRRDSDLRSPPLMEFGPNDVCW
jgi:hypothetical protein